MKMSFPICRKRTGKAISILKVLKAGDIPMCGSEMEKCLSGSGSAGNGHPDSGLNKFYTTNAFFMYDLIKGKYFLADIKKNGTTIKGNSCYINDKEQIVDTTGTVKGYVLFYIEDQTYNNERLVSSAATKVKDTLFLRCREAYRRLGRCCDSCGWHTEAVGT